MTILRAPGEQRDLDLVVLGDVNPDVIVEGGEPQFGQRELLVDSIEMTIGGSAGIMAAGAARLGLRVAIIGVVGDDPFGRFMLSELAGRGVDVSACRVDQRRPTGASVIIARRVDRAILTTMGTIGDLTAEDVPVGMVARARHLHVAAYFLQQGLQVGLPDLVAQARRSGTTVSIDPNWDPDETWDSGLRDLLRSVDLFLPNEAEACRIAGRSSVQEAARALAADVEGRLLVAVKRGVHGALAVTPDGELLEVPAYPVETVDSTGAGDAFDAGFLAARLEGRSLRDSMDFGAVCGALSTRSLGGTRSQPTRDEVEVVVRQRVT